MSPHIYALYRLTGLFLLAMFEVGRNGVAASLSELPRIGHHHGYVAQMVQPDPQQILNHEGWHKHKNLELPTLDLVAVAGSVIRSSSDEIALPSHMPDPTSTSSAVPLPGLQDHSKVEVMTTSNWTQEIEGACTLALTKGANDRAIRNPSGKEPCYNVRSINPTNGKFEADLAVYQISKPDDDWTNIVQGTLRIRLSYLHANVTQRSTQNGKRHMVVREETTESQGSSIWPRRGSQRPAPQKVGSLALRGQIEAAMLGNLKDSATAKVLLTPQIKLSATQSDGSSLTLDLELGNASFIAGVFAGSISNDSQSASHETVSPLDMKAVLAAGNKLHGSQWAPIIVAGVWAAAVTVPMFCRIMIRLKARNDYRRKIQQGYVSDVIVISYD